MENSTILEGENGDRKFTVNGRNWRVRVTENSVIPASAPANGQPDLAPSVIGISVSVAALDKKGRVAKDAAGRLLVFDAHVVTFQGEQMARGDAFDPTAIISKVINDEIALAEAKLISQEKLANLLGGWSA